MSQYNWDEAIGQTKFALTAAQRAARLDQDDPIINGHFRYIALLERQRSRDRKGLGFSVIAKETPPKLTYRELGTVLAALRSYGLQWLGPSPNKNDLVRTCRFELRITDDPDILVASGAVSLLTGPEIPGKRYWSMTCHMNNLLRKLPILLIGVSTGSVSLL